MKISKSQNTKLSPQLAHTLPLLQGEAAEARLRFASRVGMVRHLHLREWSGYPKCGILDR
jgi:hypothetical protein